MIPPRLLTDAGVYCCVECGALHEEVLRRYTSVVLPKPCDVCHKIADPYVEADAYLVSIDLILLRARAFRHVLFNTQFSARGRASTAYLFRLGAGVILCDIYCCWRDFEARGWPGLLRNNAAHLLRAISVVTLAAVAAFGAFLLTCIVLANYARCSARSAATAGVRAIAFAELAASVSLFFSFPLLAWWEGDRTFLLALQLFTFCARSLALSVATGASRAQAALTVAVASALGFAVKRRLLAIFGLGG